MLGGSALIATQGEALGVGPAPNLVLGMIFSATMLLPPVWARDGLLSDLGLPGPSRAVLALLMPLICGVAGTPFGLDSFARPPILST